MDIKRGRVPEPAAAPGLALFPSPGMESVAGFYKHEIPHPIPGDDDLGIPITVEFFGDLGKSVVGIDALLIDLTTMNEVPCYLQTPGYPFLPEYDIAQLIALIPEDPLPGGHLFRVHIQAWVDHELWGAEWDFTTRD
jgi:hypothetical protein